MVTENGLLHEKVFLRSEKLYKYSNLLCAFHDLIVYVCSHAAKLKLKIQNCFYFTNIKTEGGTTLENHDMTPKTTRNHPEEHKNHKK